MKKYIDSKAEFFFTFKRKKKKNRSLDTYENYINFHIKIEAVQKWTNWTEMEQNGLK